MRIILALLLLPSVALAELPRKVPEEEDRRPTLASISAPCLEHRRDRRYVVTWWIENKATGERRAVGAQDVRLRC